MSFRRTTGTAASSALVLALLAPAAGADVTPAGPQTASARVSAPLGETTASSATAGAEEAGPVVEPPSAAPGEPTVSRQVVESWDGTPIVTNLFLPPDVSHQQPAELVLETHGWGGTGRTAPGGLTGELVDDGYAVLTWDQRGFGCSGGQVHINDPDVEGRDVSALIDWAHEHHPIATDGDDDPVVGMVGGSYAGGIQTAAAAVDHRIDALVPDMSWSDLRYSLYPGEVVKQGWVAFLFALGTLTAEGQGLAPDCDDGPQPDAGLHPMIHRGVTEFVTTGKISEEVLDFFAASSLAHYGDQRPVAVPTLVTQSAVDTLFNLTDGLGVHEHVRDQGVDSRLLVYCGGHVNCPTTYEDGGDTAHLRAAIRDWFAVHLRGEERDLGAPVEYRTNDGEWRALEALPTVADGALTVSAAAQGLAVVPVVDVPDVGTTLAESQSTGGSLQATPLTAAAVSTEGDPRAATFEVAHAEHGPLELVGVPEVELTVDGMLLETLEQLPADDVEELLERLSLEGLEPVLDETGDLVGAAPVLGNITSGVLEGLLGPRGDEVVPGDVHVFAKFVHRETGEVVNLQEGTARVGVSDGPTTVELTMPGLAYTIPAGDHLDLQLSTASLMHATGRLPAVVDVQVEAAVPGVALPGDAGPPPHAGPGADPEHPPGNGPPADRPGHGAPADRPGIGPPGDRPGNSPPADRPGTPIGWLSAIDALLTQRGGQPPIEGTLEFLERQIQ